MTEPFKSRYMFTADVIVQSTFLGAVPGGNRVNLRYKEGTLKTDSSLYYASWAKTFGEVKLARDEAAPPKDAPPWRGLEGSVVTGNDWATITDNGVAQFEGRLTLKTSTGPLITAVMMGSNYLDPVNGLEGSKRALGALQAGTLNVDIPTLLAVRFEMAQANQPWAAKDYKDSFGSGYQALLGGQYVAKGKTTFAGQQLVTRILVDVWGLEGA